MSGTIVTLLFAVCLFGKGYGYDEDLQCPDKFIIKKVNTVTLQVNSTVIENAGCAVSPKFLAFNIQRAGESSPGIVSRLCFTEFSCPSPGPVPDPTPEEAKCGCVQKSQNSVASFELKLYVDESKDSRANISFNLCSRPLKPITRNKAASCSKIAVGEEDEPLGTGAIVGIVIGVIALLAIVVGVILFLRSRGFLGQPVSGSDV